MSIIIESTTDSKEAVAAAMGDLASGDIKVDPAAAAVKAAEKLEASETSPGKEPVDETAEQKEEREQADKGKKKGGFKKRIDKLNTKLSKAESETQYWRNEALKNQTPKSAEKVESKVEAKDGRPNKDDFEDHDAYVEAVTDWKMEQKLASRDQKARETELKSEGEKQGKALKAQIAEFVKTHDDWQESMEDIDHIPMSITVQQVILESDNGPELMYALAKNPEEYERICKLPAVAAARALGRFEAGLAKADATPKKEGKTTKAPEPIKPVGAKGTGTGKKSLDDPSLSQREYEKLREEQLAARRA